MRHLRVAIVRHSDRGVQILAGQAADESGLATTEAAVMERTIVRLGMVFLMPLVCVLWMALGFVSPQRLGRVLEETGLRLQEYTW